MLEYPQAETATLLRDFCARHEPRERNENASTDRPDLHRPDVCLAITPA
jgi:hypothetical protein